jgi:NAD(P)-dependent dehydrogenase (short-subunit alcohol dehydrogenase family)
MENLEGKVAVVTGAASGIGRATALAFANAGMKVVLSDVEEEPLAEAEAEFEAAGHEVAGVRADVSKWDDVENLATATLDHFGAVHVVHNNAGVVLGGPVEELSIADWEWVLGVNLWGAIHGVKAFVPHIKAAGEGHVINTASTAGLHAMSIIGPYNVSKFGVVALSETLRRELDAAGSPVGASVLCPGVVATKIGEAGRNRPAESAAEHVSSPQEEGFLSAVSQMSPQGMDPAKVGDLVVDAVRSNRFWILTHPDWFEVLEQRVKDMPEGKLNDGFGG